jgi:hypothetical protein
MSVTKNLPALPTSYVTKGNTTKHPVGTLYVSPRNDWSSWYSYVNILYFLSALNCILAYNRVLEQKEKKGIIIDTKV